MKNIDEYIKSQEEDIQAKLNELHDFIKKQIPKETEERLSWSMPTFYLNGNLIHFAAHKNHIGFYPGASGIENFQKEFVKLNLKYSKGAVQFPYQNQLPKDLIKRIIAFRIKENLK